MTYKKYVQPVTQTPQSEAIPGREAEMQMNAAGGFGFKTDAWQRLSRFLYIGTEGGTFYESEKDITKQNLSNIMDCITDNGLAVVQKVVEVSASGDAYSNSPAIFVLALCAVRGNERVRFMAYQVMPQVCRTGTHLFEFAEYVKTLRGKITGRQAKRGFANWYTEKDAKSLAYQVTKYQQREGWSHRDLIRLSHAHAAEAGTHTVIGYAAGKLDPINYHPDNPDWHRYLGAVEAVKKITSLESICQLIKDESLPREVIPTEWLNKPEVWNAMLAKMPLMALVRNLPKMTELGLFAPFSPALDIVCLRLSAHEYIRKSKIHPLALLLALKTYSSGHSLRGEKSWTPNLKVVAALEGAFYLSFDNIEPIGKNILIAVDISSSMDANVQNINMEAFEAGAAFMMVYLRSQKTAHPIVFGTESHEFDVPTNARLAEVTNALRKYREGTDLAQPVLYALKNNLKVDGFLIITDTESWAGRIHPAQALAKYRHTMNSSARMVNVMTTASQTQQNDPSDRLSLEIAGFSPAVFQIANQFFQEKF